MSTQRSRARDRGAGNAGSKQGLVSDSLCLGISGCSGGSPGSPALGHFSRLLGLSRAGRGPGRAGEGRYTEGPLAKQPAWVTLPRPPIPGLPVPMETGAKRGARGWEPSPGGCQAPLPAARWDREVPFSQTIPAGSESEGLLASAELEAGMEEGREEKEGSE